MAKIKGASEEIRKMDPVYTRAYFDPQTVNEKERTVEVTFATDKAIRMNGWDGPFDEILSMEKGHVRMERLNAGAPLLDNHNRYEGVKGQLGVVVKASIDGKLGRATVKYSKRADVEEVWNDVKDGILKGISVGYRVYEYEITDKEGQVPVYRAIDWEPFEISHAPVPADFTSSVRGTDNKTQNEVKIRGLQPSNTNETRTMEKTPAELEVERLAAEKLEKDRKAQLETERKAGVELEKTRTAAIVKAVRAAKLSETFAQTLIDTDKSIDEARALILEEFAKEDPAAGARSGQNPPAVTKDEADKRREGMTVAIMHRSAPGSVKPEEIRGSEFRGMSLRRLAAECVELAGGKTRGLTDSEVARMSLGLLDGRSAGMLSTSDFPLILGNTVNRVLLREYALAPRTFKSWTRQTTATDFRTMTRTRLGEADSFDKIVEGGEYKSGAMGENAESFKVEKFGKIIGITWETLVNDDLDAFSRVPQKIAAAAARKQSDIIYAILSSNPNMSDGVALFHATHGNLGTAAAIAIASLGEARKLMRVQKGIDKKDYLNLAPRALVVGPVNETLALQFTSSEYLPNTQSQVNPYKNLSIEVEPRITGTEWYVMSDTGAVDTIEYAFLEGEGELFTETKQGFEVDGLQIKARMVFGAKAIDFRGMVKNAGV